MVVIDFEDGPPRADPLHSHPHEQVTYVAEGEILFLSARIRAGFSGDMVAVPARSAPRDSVADLPCPPDRCVHAGTAGFPLESSLNCPARRGARFKTFLRPHVEPFRYFRTLPCFSVLDDSLDLLLDNPNFSLREAMESPSGLFPAKWRFGFCQSRYLHPEHLPKVLNISEPRSVAFGASELLDAWARIRRCSEAEFSQASSVNRSSFESHSLI